MSWVDLKWPLPGYQKQVKSMTQDASERFVTCKHCDARITESAYMAGHKVCPVCGHHHIMTAHERLSMLTQGSDCLLLGEDYRANDYLSFSDLKPYSQRLADAQKKTKMTEAVLCAVSEIEKIPAVFALFDFQFIGGSLGGAVGDRIVLAIETAVAQNKPFICVTASGGARMQEGILSLFQMARMSAAVSRLQKTCLPFINVLTHPTFGGVSASIAMQGDIIIAEPGAHIGFTGARVIANAMQQPLPEGFQTAEYLQAHGAIDAVVPRHSLTDYIARALRKALVNQ